MTNYEKYFGTPEKAAKSYLDGIIYTLTDCAYGDQNGCCDCEFMKGEDYRCTEHERMIASLKWLQEEAE